MERIDTGDFLAIAEQVLDTPAEQLRRVIKIGSLESALAAPHAGFGDADIYPEFHVKAAILCSRIVRNHPLPDGNKRMAYAAMIVSVRMSGGTWNPPADPDEADRVIRSLAAGDLSEEDFAAWVADHVTAP